MYSIQERISESIQISTKVWLMVKDSKESFVKICTDILVDSLGLGDGVIDECYASLRDYYSCKKLVAMGILAKIFPALEHENLEILTKLRLCGEAWNCCAQQTISEDPLKEFFYYDKECDFIFAFSRILNDHHFLFFDCNLEVFMVDNIVIGAILKTKIFLETELITMKIFFGKAASFEECQDKKRQKILGILPGLVKDKTVHEALINLSKTFFVVDEDYADYVVDGTFHEFFAWMQESYWYGDLILSPRSTKPTLFIHPAI